MISISVSRISISVYWISTVFEIYIYIFIFSTRTDRTQACQGANRTVEAYSFRANLAANFGPSVKRSLLAQGVASGAQGAGGTLARCSGSSRSRFCEGLLAWPLSAKDGPHLLADLGRQVRLGTTLSPRSPHPSTGLRAQATFILGLQTTRLHKKPIFLCTTQEGQGILQGQIHLLALIVHVHFVHLMGFHLQLCTRVLCDASTLQAHLGQERVKLEGRGGEKLTSITSCCCLISRRCLSTRFGKTCGWQCLLQGGGPLSLSLPGATFRFPAAAKSCCLQLSWPVKASIWVCIVAAASSVRHMLAEMQGTCWVMP
jgi:hypothetical protein